ncbi:hypothetical protein DQK32_25025 [Salmonella enterica subsp. enterica serovar Newport]|uniref:Chemoreceptor zinc-binding domain-containing protein n=1 Tax=Salmonella newport TaxID=108619 RepID=A0A5U9VT87_SALNE|nr:hypothetical protein [Salmonella enterica subsp. enterica serovar Newport]
MLLAPCLLGIQEYSRIFLFVYLLCNLILYFNCLRFKQKQEKDVISGDNSELFSMVYRMLQFKQVHVLYTAEKAEKLYTRMSVVADENDVVTDGITGLVNRMYSLRGRLKNKLGSLTLRERRYGKQVIALLSDLIEENEKIQRKMAVSANTMRCASYSLQMTVFKAIHYQWRERVYMSVLEGKNTFPPEDEYHCMLGRWYHGEGRTVFGALPAFARLGDAHSRLHLALSELVRESLRENPTPKSLLKKLDVLDAASQAVIGALDDMDDSAIRQGTAGDVSSEV